MATVKKACKGVSYPKSSSVSKRLGSPSKAKNGKSFPDLNKDGKITKADVLKGRGVIAKKGMKVKKAQAGAMQKIEKGKPGAPSPRFQMEMQKFKYKQSMDKIKLDKKNKEEEALRPKAFGTAKKGMKVKKAQNGDSTAYYNKFAKNMATKSKQAENKGDTATSNMYMDVMLKANQASQRQKLKGKPGYDKMGNPVKKNKMGGKTKKCAYGCK